MNQFGGDWTERKIEIAVEYAKAYLTIMNNILNTNAFISTDLQVREIFIKMIKLSLI